MPRSPVAGWNLLPLVALLLAFLCSCSQEPARKSGKPALPVEVAPVARRSVPVELQTVGQVEASSQVTVRSQVAGVIAAVHFQEGAWVRQGELLFSLNQAPFKAALGKAEADLAQARAAAAKADRDAERYRKLLASGYVSHEEADTVLSAADRLQAALAAARATVDDARIRLGYCSIRAPQAGRTGALLVHPGTLVKANDAPDLVTINTLQPVSVAFSIPEDSLPTVRRQLASGALEVAALPKGDDRPPETGRLAFLNNRVDPATGTIRLKARFENRDLRLWPGQFVAVTLVLKTLDDVLVVPTAAVQTGQRGSYLFVVGADRKVALRPVQAGLGWRDLTVIDAGLQPGETVVTAGQLRLFPGATVEVKTATARASGEAHP